MKMIIRNQMADFQAFSQYLKSLSPACLIGFEPTGDYHRNLAYFLKKEGFDLCLVSSLAVAPTRDALHNSWDKNEPKDDQVILHLMKTGVTQRCNAPRYSSCQIESRPLIFKVFFFKRVWRFVTYCRGLRLLLMRLASNRVSALTSKLFSDSSR